MEEQSFIYQNQHIKLIKILLNFMLKTEILLKLELKFLNLILQQLMVV